MATLTTYTKSIDRNLTNEGYLFLPSSFGSHLVTVVIPGEKGVYNVDLKRGTCDCIAGKRGIRCCHLREADAAALVAKAQETIKDRVAFEKMKSADFD